MREAIGWNYESGSLPTAVHFNTLSCGEGIGDRGVPLCDQFKSSQQISPQGEVQNGGAPYCSLSPPRGRLYDEARPEECLLHSPNTLGIKEILLFPVQGNNIQVQLPPVWPLSGSPGLHQNPLSCCGETALGRNLPVIYLDDLLLIHNQKDTLTETFHSV